MDDSTLSYHARPGGRDERVRSGLYRLRNFPSSPHEEVVASWLPLRDDGAVVSHESALELYGLSDIIPRSGSIVTLPRSKRGHRRGRRSSYMPLKTRLARRRCGNSAPSW